MMFSAPGFFSDFSIFSAFLFWGLTVAVHLAFAVGVYADAADLRRSRSGPSLVGPFWWTSATLVGGVFVAGLYWVVHHSTLRRDSYLKEGTGVQTGLD